MLSMAQYARRHLVFAESGRPILNREARRTRFILLSGLILEEESVGVQE